MGKCCCFVLLRASLHVFCTFSQYEKQRSDFPTARPSGLAEGHDFGDIRAGFHGETRWTSVQTLAVASDSGKMGGVRVRGGEDFNLLFVAASWHDCVFSSVIC